MAGSKMVGDFLKRLKDVPTVEFVRGAMSGGFMVDLVYHNIVDSAELAAIRDTAKKVEEAVEETKKVAIMIEKNLNNKIQESVNKMDESVEKAVDSIKKAVEEAFESALKHGLEQPFEKALEKSFQKTIEKIASARADEETASDDVPT